MQLQRPFRVITPTVDGDVLRVLAGADASFTPPRVHSLMGRHSESGVRRSLQRLAEQGIVSQQRVGQAVTYRLNREHLAAPHIVAIAGLYQDLLASLRDLLRQWSVPCEYAALFGSAVRREMRPDSDIDVFVVRPSAVDGDDPTWRVQLDSLPSRVSAWTGNDTRVLEFDAGEVATGLEEAAGVLVDIRTEGVRLFGPATYLRGALVSG